ncbi:MAG TPA: prepilin-type N-terminal cleavage/methylation domain-containing protein, partial [Candidatus Methylacidiphilales bacterium]
MNTFRMRRRSTRAFSLIEVLLALGIISFAMVALIGLFALGLKTNKESADQIEAANIASLLLSTLRAIPTNPPPGFALPALNQATVTKTVQVGPDGTTASAASGLGAGASINKAYNLYYV